MAIGFGNVNYLANEQESEDDAATTQAGGVSPVGATETPNAATTETPDAEQTTLDKDGKPLDLKGQLRATYNKLKADNRGEMNKKDGYKDDRLKAEYNLKGKNEKLNLDRFARRTKNIAEKAERTEEQRNSDRRAVIRNLFEGLAGIGAASIHGWSKAQGGEGLADYAEKLTAAFDNIQAKGAQRQGLAGEEGEDFSNLRGVDQARITRSERYKNMQEQYVAAANKEFRDFVNDDKTMNDFIEKAKSGGLTSRTQLANLMSSMGNKKIVNSPEGKEWLDDLAAAINNEEQTKNMSKNILYDDMMSMYQQAAASIANSRASEDDIKIAFEQRGYSFDMLNNARMERGLAPFTPTLPRTQEQKEKAVIEAAKQQQEYENLRLQMQTKTIQDIIEYGKAQDQNAPYTISAILGDKDEGFSDEFLKKYASRLLDGTMNNSIYREKMGYFLNTLHVDDPDLIALLRPVNKNRTDAWVNLLNKARKWNGWKTDIITLRQQIGQ